jgi:hypothetical protein
VTPVQIRRRQKQRDDEILMKLEQSGLEDFTDN